MAGVVTRQNAPTDVDSHGHYSKLMHYSWARTPAALAAQTLAQREKLLKPTGEGGDSSQMQAAPIRLMSTANTERFVDVILSCLDMLLISRRREVSITRVLAFVKRLSSLALVIVSFFSFPSIIESSLVLDKHYGIFATHTGYLLMFISTNKYG